MVNGENSGHFLIHIPENSTVLSPSIGECIGLGKALLEELKGPGGRCRRSWGEMSEYD